MQDTDRLIEDAVDAEERELLRSLEAQGFFEQAFGIFRGPAGWTSIVMMIAQAALFVSGVWAAWRFFEADDPVSQLRWGLPAAVLLIFATQIKFALIPRMEGNRLMRELKRIELHVARSERR